MTDKTKSYGKSLAEVKRTTSCNNPTNRDANTAIIF